MRHKGGLKTNKHAKGAKEWAASAVSGAQFHYISEAVCCPCFHGFLLKTATLLCLEGCAFYCLQNRNSGDLSFPLTRS